MDRLRRAEAAFNLDDLDALARAFELQPWQLLVDGLDPNSPPVIAAMSKQERDLYARMRQDLAELARLEQLKRES